MEARVLLIRPLCEGDEPEFAEPLGIERLAGYLRAHGVPEVGVFDRRLYQRERRAGLGVGSFWDDVRDWAASGAPDVVGISLMTESDVPDALRVLSRAHAWWPQARLAAGGLFVTTAAAGAARRLPAGVTLLAGEGEATLLALGAGIPSHCGTLRGAGLCCQHPDIARLPRGVRLLCDAQASRGTAALAAAQPVAGGK